MQFNTTAPIYLQIMDKIKNDIVTGVLARGDRIDSVRALSAKFEVNMNTMQRAFSELERQGVIFTQRGIGSFVTEDESVISALKEEMSTKLIESFVCGMEGLGYNKNETFQIIRKALEI
ncbi:MAG TPA: GntR family transcriptional regulator [Syntrophomonadaceae bacterium]|nr:GntR family transcriptional regulator [Syntrophomonadaceae bacterium]